MNKTSLFSTSFNSGSSATVIWDLELCPVPKNFKGYQAVRLIKDFILSKGLQLTQIVAIGSSRVLSNQTRGELEDCGVSVQNLHSKSPAAADISILHEVIKLVYFHRPPHSIVLISGDRDYSKILNFLDQVHYHVVYVHAKDVSDVMQFSITDRIGWWELLGCQISDIDFRPPYIPVPVPNDDQIQHIPLKSGNGLVLKSNSTVSELKSTSLQITKPDHLRLEKANASTDKSKIQKVGTLVANPPSVNLTLKEKPRSINYDQIIEHLQKQPNFTSFFGDIGSNCRKVASLNGFTTLKEYLFQAEADGIVILSNKNEPSGHVNVRLAPLYCKQEGVSSSSKPSASSPIFDELVALLESSKSRSLAIGDINMTSKHINKKYGYSSLRAYLAVAEQAGLIKITGREDRNGRTVVQIVHLKKRNRKGSNHNDVTDTHSPRISSTNHQSKTDGESRSSQSNGNQTSNPHRFKKAFWDLIEFLRSLPEYQFVSAAQIAKYCPSILRKSTYDSLQSLFYAAKELGLIAINIDGADDKDLDKFMVQLLVNDSQTIMALLDAAKTDGAEQSSVKVYQQAKPSTDGKPVFTLQKQFVPSPSTLPSKEPVWENPKPTRITIRSPLDVLQNPSDIKETKKVVEDLKKDSKTDKTETENLDILLLLAENLPNECPDTPIVNQSFSSESPRFAPAADKSSTQNDFAFAEEMDPYFPYESSESVKQSSTLSASLLCQTLPESSKTSIKSDDKDEEKNQVVEADESSGSSLDQKSIKYGTANFFWPHSGQSVAVTGTWDQWNSDILMLKQGNVWRLEKSLPVGRYEFEFVVDGISMVDDNQEYVEDDESCHNIVVVE